MEQMCWRKANTIKLTNHTKNQFPYGDNLLLEYIYNIYIYYIYIIYVYVCIYVCDFCCLFAVSILFFSLCEMSDVVFVHYTTQNTHVCVNVFRHEHMNFISRVDPSLTSAALYYLLWGKTTQMSDTLLKITTKLPL